MTLDVSIAIDIIEVMENYIDSVHLPASRRQQIRLDYEITGQSVILYEVRALRSHPGRRLRIDFARATFVKSKGIWKTYWRRPDSDWHPYAPCPIVHDLREFIWLVEEDQHRCFTI